MSLSLPLLSISIYITIRESFDSLLLITIDPNPYCIVSRENIWS